MKAELCYGCDKEHDAGLYDLCAGIRYNPPQPFGATDVEKVIAEWSDGSDEPCFVWLLKLKDGKFATASGGHDYTGWDCQSSLSAQVFRTKREAIRMGLTLNEREHLGLLLPGESIPAGEP